MRNAMTVLFLAAAALGAGSAPAQQPAGPAAATATATATFAGGCFWCMQPPFDKLPGVVSTRVGYTGGTKKAPTYEEVSSGGTGHLESIEVAYDPKRVSYKTLLDTSWINQQ